MNKNLQGKAKLCLMSMLCFLLNESLFASNGNGLSPAVIDQLEKTQAKKPAPSKPIDIPRKRTVGERGTFKRPPLKPASHNGVQNGSVAVQTSPAAKGVKKPIAKPVAAATHSAASTPVEKTVAHHKVQVGKKQAEANKSKNEFEKPSKIGLATEKHLLEKVRNMGFKHIKSTLFMIQEMSGLTEKQKEEMWLEHQQTLKASGLKNLDAAKLKREYFASMTDNWQLTPEQQARVGSAYIAKVKTVLKAERTKPSYKELFELKLSHIGQYIYDAIKVNENPDINAGLLREDVREIEKLLK